jgi:23S rRNA (guanosine2251-2'-O)-methyltransferase
MNIICGINPVLEALSSGTRHFDRLLVAKGLRNRRVSEAMRLASQLGVPLRFETRETLDRMAGEVPHQGLVGVVSAKPVMSLEALLEEARPPELLVVLDGVEDPRNLGAILRTTEAAGADGVLLPERHSAGLSETVARASAGGLEHVKVARIGNVVQALEELKQRGFWVVGFDAAGTERWDAVDYKGKVALVFGGEGRGMRRLVREKCDHVASLPLFGHVGSLNVSVVAGIALYEAVRQRGAVPSHVRPIPASVRPGPDGAALEPEEAPEEPEERLALVHVEEHDAAAWSPPVVLNNVGPRHRRHARHDERRLHPRGKRRAQGDAPRERPEGSGAGPGRGRGAGRGPGPAPGEAEAAPVGAGAERPRQGKRRRRRNRGPAQGRGPAQAPARGQAPEAGQGTLGGDAPAPGAGGAPNDHVPGTGPQQHGREGAPGGPRKGRRHRRRRRRPPAPAGS